MVWKTLVTAAFLPSLIIAADKGRSKRQDDIENIPHSFVNPPCYNVGLDISKLPCSKRPGHIPANFNGNIASDGVKDNGERKLKRVKRYVSQVLPFLADNYRGPIPAYNAVPGAGQVSNPSPSCNLAPGAGQIDLSGPSFDLQPGGGQIDLSGPSFNLQPGGGQADFSGPSFNSQPGGGQFDNIDPGASNPQIFHPGQIGTDNLQQYPFGNHPGSLPGNHGDVWDQNPNYGPGYSVGYPNDQFFNGQTQSPSNIYPSFGAVPGGNRGGSRLPSRGHNLGG